MRKKRVEQNGWRKERRVEEVEEGQGCRENKMEKRESEAERTIWTREKKVEK